MCLNLILEEFFIYIDGEHNGFRNILNMQTDFNHNLPIYLRIYQYILDNEIIIILEKLFVFSYIYFKNH